MIAEVAQAIAKAFTDSTSVRVEVDRRPFRSTFVPTCKHCRRWLDDVLVPDDVFEDGHKHAIGAVVGALVRVSQHECAVTP